MIIMASQGDAVCVLESVVCGHHIYNVVWTPRVGEVLAVSREPGNSHDRHAICVKRGGDIAGHVPRQFLRMVWYFGSQAVCEVTGRTKFGHELEVPCTYKFTGTEKLITRLQELLLMKRPFSQRNSQHLPCDLVCVCTLFVTFHGHISVSVKLLLLQ